MSTPHGCNDNTAVVDNFKEALVGRVGSDRYQMWFAHGIECEFIAPETDCIDDVPNRGSFLLRIRGQFALDRVRKNFLREIRGAAAHACGETVEVQLCLDEPPAQQVDLPLVVDADEAAESNAPKPKDAFDPSGKPSDSQQHRKPAAAKAKRSHRRRSAQSLSNLIAQGTGAKRNERQQTDPESSTQPSLPNLDSIIDEKRRSSAPLSAATAPDISSQSLVAGPCNQLAMTAMSMVCQDPSTASPLFLCGPSGTGKTQILSTIAAMLRRRHRMRRVMHLSAEQFTNDFISSVGSSGITAFRRRYRDVDALLIDDVQFLGAKQATLREMLYTVETLSGDSRPLVFSGLQSPTEIPGLSRELAGRMAAGLICQLQPIDLATRTEIFRRWIDERCHIEVPDHIIDQVTPMLAGDGRVISGVVNMINTLQRMYGRTPTMDEMRRHGGDLLRAAQPVATLSVIESAVCEAFHLPSDALRGGSQTRAVSQPRMLAMYLSRQLTSSAYVEIARHFGGKSHSTAISAEKNVKSWLEGGKAIGRGGAAMSAEQAIDRVEGLLRSS